MNEDVRQIAKEWKEDARWGVWRAVVGGAASLIVGVIILAIAAHP